jgi:cytochrome c oxidase assembly protein subunit 15
MQVSPSRYRWITGLALGLLVAIVISGAAVRLTGSGLGCDDWPNCNSTRLIDVSSSHAAIEQINRLFTGLVSVGVIAAVLGSRWRRPRRRELELLSYGLVAGVLAQIVLGGILVLFDLHPILVQGHMVLSLVLVGTAVVLHHRAGEPDGTVRVAATSPPATRLTWVLATLTGVVVLLGTVVTGAGPHAGDEDVERLGVDIGAAARAHGIAVMLTLAVAVALAVLATRRREDRRLSTTLSSWIFVGLLQAAIGYIQYFNDVPALLVGVHVAGATLLWALTVQLVLATRVAVEPPCANRNTELSGYVDAAR